MEVILNRNDIEELVKSYSKENSKFCLKSFVDNPNQKKCTFFLNGVECKVVFYLKKKTINILPIGKNINECNMLIDYIYKKGFDSNIKSVTYTFEINNFDINDLLEFVKNECKELITYSIDKNIYRFKGYNEDELVLTVFSNKIMIQAKPFFVYGIISTFFASMDGVSFDEVIVMNSTFTEMNLPSNLIRDEMKQRLGKSYDYLDEALRKSISGSITMLKSKNICEDYTGHIAGIFKGLEGYLKKILNQKYNYRIKKNQTFSMFHTDEMSNLCEIDNDVNILSNCKISLKKLYSLYSNKRNIYLHTTVDPSMTKIVETKCEAISLADEILKEIKDSYEQFF